MSNQKPIRVRCRHLCGSCMSRACGGDGAVHGVGTAFLLSSRVLCLASPTRLSALQGFAGGWEGHKCGGVRGGRVSWSEEASMLSAWCRTLGECAHSPDSPCGIQIAMLACSHARGVRQAVGSQCSPPPQGTQDVNHSLHPLVALCDGHAPCDRLTTPFSRRPVCVLAGARPLVRL